MGSNVEYWQQRANYDIHIDMDVDNSQYKGYQKLEYFNNSPDDLSVLYYHLYFNAFQPGSEMDITLQNVADPDLRMVLNEGTDESPIYRSKIAVLNQDEIGFIDVRSLAQDGKEVTFHVNDTILIVYLGTPVKSGESTNLEMHFLGQVPKLILRAGRDSEEGVKLSMAQWYPKIAEYDFEGWHDHPYIRREFHGVWGDYKITIDIDDEYIIAGTGLLVEKEKIQNNKFRWVFNAENIHDYTWAADKDYLFDQVVSSKGTILEFYYKNNQKYIHVWKEVQPYIARIMDFYSDYIGEYPFEKYSIIQGGNGGMEYALCTLVTGDRDLRSLLRVIAHEMGHMWFQHVLATNETKHGWMDEGFTKYIEHVSTIAIAPKLFTKEIFRSSYDEYFRLLNTEKEEPQTTHSERYLTNKSYHASIYAKGEIFLIQLGYIIGDDNLLESLRKYFEEWKFKHPTPTNFKRVVEKVSNMNLDWYFLGWTQTIKTINYSIEEVNEIGDEVVVTLKREGEMPMPIEVLVTYTNQTQELFYIPFSLMRRDKEFKEENLQITKCKYWTFSQRSYQLNIKSPLNKIESIIIDNDNKMANLSTKRIIKVQN